MSNEVTKELAVKLTAQDETEGVWKKTEDQAEKVVDKLDKVNKKSKETQTTWEKMDEGFTKITDRIYDLGQKAWGYMAAGATVAIDALSRGGVLNETSAAFERLEGASRLGGPAMVEAFRDITAGVMSLDDAMKLASKSMQRGLSDEQAITIATFAKRYSEATGVSMESVQESIEKAIVTGRRLEQLEIFGISIQRGQEMSSVLDTIRVATDKISQGAFSFADTWQGTWQRAKDAVDLVMREVNRLMAADFDDYSDRFADAMNSIGNEAPAIAAALWIPIREIGTAVDWLIGGFDNIGTSIVTFALGAGNTFFELTKLFGTLGQTVAWTVDKFYAMNETIAWVRRNTSLVEYIQAQRKAWGEYGNSFSEVDRAQKEFNDTILNSRTLDEAAMETRKKSRLTVDELALGIQKVGGATKELSEETKKLTAEEKKVNSEYQRRIDLYKSLGIGYQKVAGGTAEEWTPMKYSQFSTGGQAGASRGGMEGSSIDIAGKDGSAQSGIIQLGAPPGDPLLNLIVDYINRAIQAEGTIGAGF